MLCKPPLPSSTGATLGKAVAVPAWNDSAGEWGGGCLQGVLWLLLNLPLCPPPLYACTRHEWASRVQWQNPAAHDGPRPVGNSPAQALLKGVGARPEPRAGGQRSACGISRAATLPRGRRFSRFHLSLQCQQTEPPVATSLRLPPLSTLSCLCTSLKKNPPARPSASKKDSCGTRTPPSPCSFSLQSLLWPLFQGPIRSNSPSPTQPQRTFPDLGSCWQGCVGAGPLGRVGPSDMLKPSWKYGHPSISRQFRLKTKATERDSRPQGVSPRREVPRVLDLHTVLSTLRGFLPLTHCPGFPKVPPPPVLPSGEEGARQLPAPEVPWEGGSAG